MRPTATDLERAEGTEADDLLGPDLRLLVVGINPSLWTAAVNAHFARPGNRFWKALHAAGITSHEVDASTGFDPADVEELHTAGIGITNLVQRATRRADELSAGELRAGRDRLESLVASVRPRVVAVAGVSAYRVAFGVPRARVGRQPECLGEAELWVVPNPSGLNAHWSLAALAEAYAEPARAAGVLA